MGSDKPARQKALEIAQTASWIGSWDDVPPDVESALDRAREALRFISESAIRNQVCATLLSHSEQPGPAAVQAVRGLTAALFSEPASKLRGTTETLMDDTILAALWAWHGGKPEAGVDKWTATAAVFRECGLANVDPSSLRKAWDRRIR